MRLVVVSSVVERWKRPGPIVVCGGFLNHLNEDPGNTYIKRIKRTLLILTPVALKALQIKKKTKKDSIS